MDIGIPYRELFSYHPEELHQLLMSANEDIWEKNDYRQTTFAVHRNTKSIVYVWSNFSDPDYQSIVTHIPEDDPDPIHREVWKVAKKIRHHFGERSKITKLMLAKLDKRSEIMEHVDQGNLTRIHRCHLPVITNSDCFFLIDKKPYSFKPSFAFEFNNQKLHGVRNNGAEDRVHLICDILD